jgi:hypothetical protein
MKEKCIIRLKRNQNIELEATLNLISIASQRDSQ